MFPGKYSAFFTVLLHPILYLEHGLLHYTYVKNYEEFEVYPYLQPIKSACYSFIDAGRLYETPRKETKDSLLLNAKIGARVAAFFVPIPQAPLHID